MNVLPPTSDPAFPRVLRELRTKHNLTQAQIADECALRSRQSPMKWEQPKSGVRPSEAKWKCLRDLFLREEQRLEREEIVKKINSRPAPKVAYVPVGQSIQYATTDALVGELVSRGYKVTLTR